MPSRRLLAVVTALVLAAGRTAAQEYSLEQVLEVERLILAKDVEALKLYLEGNPALLLGDDAFAAELRLLKRQIDEELVTQFSFRRGLDFEPQDMLY